jgi:hypothetical protein
MSRDEVIALRETALRWGLQEMGDQLWAVLDDPLAREVPTEAQQREEAAVDAVDAEDDDTGSVVDPLARVVRTETQTQQHLGRAGAAGLAQHAVEVDPRKHQESKPPAVDAAGHDVLRAQDSAVKENVDAPCWQLRTDLKDGTLCDNSRRFVANWSSRAAAYGCAQLPARFEFSVRLDGCCKDTRVGISTCSSTPTARLFVDASGAATRTVHNRSSSHKCLSRALCEGDLVSVRCDFSTRAGRILFGLNGVWFDAWDNADASRGYVLYLQQADRKALTVTNWREDQVEAKQIPEENYEDDDDDVEEHNMDGVQDIGSRGCWVLRPGTGRAYCTITKVS